MKLNKLIFLLFIVIVLNLNINPVKAYDSSSCNGEKSGCAVCSYGLNNNFTIDFLVKGNSNSISLSEEYNKVSSSAPMYYNINSITKIDFISNGQIKCPSSIKYNPTSDRVVFSFKSGSITLSLNNKSFNNNITNTSSSSNSKTNTTSTNTTSTNNTNTSSSNTNSSSVEGTEVSGCGVLGEETRLYIKSIFFWIQIFGPILALILTMVDITQAIASGDDDAKKKVYKKIPIRVLAAVVLALLPFILDLILMIIDEFSGTTCRL